VSDILAERTLTPAAAARELNLQVPDARFTPTGIWRWMTRGALAEDGQRIWLEHVRLGRRRITSREALSRFAARLARVGTTSAPNREKACPSKARAMLEQNGFFS
jgi:hypothetical protein